MKEIHMFPTCPKCNMWTCISNEMALGLQFEQLGSIPEFIYLFKPYKLSTPPFLFLNNNKIAHFVL